MTGFAQKVDEKITWSEKSCTEKEARPGMAHLWYFKLTVVEKYENDC